MEDQPQPTVMSIAIKYGIILGMISIIFFILLDFLGQAQNQSGWNYLGLIFTIVAYYFAYREFKEDGDGFMTYGQGLGIGTLSALFSSIISGVFMFVYISFINPNFLENVKQMQIVELEKQGLSDAQIEQAQPMMDLFTSPVMISVMAIAGGTFLGFIIALIMSAIFKKTNPQAI